MIVSGIQMNDKNWTHDHELIKFKGKPVYVVINIEKAV